LNSKILELLERIEALPNNWDEDDSLAPSKDGIVIAKAIIHLMNSIGQQIYHITPGPNGEVMLDFRTNTKSFEIIIYSDKMKYVKFPEKGDPEQGEFSPELLYTELIAWLNS
jgi:hypothetical protein